MIGLARSRAPAGETQQKQCCQYSDPHDVFDLYAESPGKSLQISCRFGRLQSFRGELALFPLSSLDWNKLRAAAFRLRDLLQA